MTNWNTTRLGNFITHKKGFAFKSKDYCKSGTPIIRVSDLTENSVDLSQCHYINHDLARVCSDYELVKDDLIITTVGSWQYNPQSVVGKVVKVPQQADGGLLNQNAVRLRAKQFADQLFLYYRLKLTDFSDYLITGAQGSANQAAITLDQIFNFTFCLPEPRIRHRIAEILSALDDKIELNRRMNHTLEQMAQTLFRQYFMYGIDEENLPEGWRKGKLSNILELVYGKALKQGDRKGGDYLVVGSSGIVGYHNSYLAEGKGIVVGRKGNAGAVIWLDQKFYPIDTTYYVVDQLQVESLYFHYFLLKSLPLAGMNSDSAVPGLNRNDAYNIDILIPSRESIIDFNNKVKPLFDQKHNKEKEIATLTQLRDSLLPKLMSGEMDVMQTKPEDLHEPILN